MWKFYNSWKWHFFNTPFIYHGILLLNISKRVQHFWIYLNIIKFVYCTIKSIKKGSYFFCPSWYIYAQNKHGAIQRWKLENQQVICHHYFLIVIFDLFNDGNSANKYSEVYYSERVVTIIPLARRSNLMFIVMNSCEICCKVNFYTIFFTQYLCTQLYVHNFYSHPFFHF